MKTLSLRRTVSSSRRHQGGAALFVAMIILVVLTVISLASLNTSLLELRMAGNEEAGAQALQAAQGGIDNTIAVGVQAENDPLNSDLTKEYFKVTGIVGDTNCTTSTTNFSPSPVCNRNEVVLSAPFDTTVQVQVVRTSGDAAKTGVTRCPTAATFRIDSIYDRSGVGQGKAEIIEGYMACNQIISGQGPSTGPITPASGHN